MPPTPSAPVPPPEGETTPMPPPTSSSASLAVAPEPKPFTTLAPPVVVPALLVLGALLVFCGFFPDSAERLFSGAQVWVVGHFDWFYTVAVTAFLIFLVLKAASRFGDIR